jgi:hypothetical protein
MPTGPDQLTGMAKIQKHQTKEILPPKSKISTKKNKNNTGLQSPFLLTRLVHFLAAIWHNLSPPLTQERIRTGKDWRRWLTLGSTARKSLFECMKRPIENNSSEDRRPRQRETAEHC